MKLHRKSNWELNEKESGIILTDVAYPLFCFCVCCNNWKAMQDLIHTRSHGLLTFAFVPFCERSPSFNEGIAVGLRYPFSHVCQILGNLQLVSNIPLVQALSVIYKGIATMQFSKHLTSLLLRDFWNDNWNVMLCSSLERENYISYFNPHPKWSF
jgi:hypothetical protein